MDQRINEARLEIGSALMNVRPALQKNSHWRLGDRYRDRPEPSRCFGYDSGSKFTLIKKVDSKHAEVVTSATISLLQPYLDKNLTITADNGKEFAGHETIKEQLSANVYFAHPYCSWERGLNENINGLIR
jgi:hypothetical protein